MTRPPALPLHELMRLHGLTVNDFGAKRMKGLLLWRAQAFYAAAMDQGHGAFAIGRFVGRDHSTIIHGAMRARKNPDPPAQPAAKAAPTPAPPPQTATPPTPPERPPRRQGRPPGPPKPKPPRPGRFMLHGRYEARYVRTDHDAVKRGCQSIYVVEVRSGVTQHGAVGDDCALVMRMCCDDEVPESVRDHSPGGGKMVDKSLDF